MIELKEEEKSEIVKKLLEDEELKEEVLIRLKPKEWMDINGAAKYLSMSVRSLQRLINKNQIPYKYIPGTKRKRFKKRHLDIWLETGKNVLIDNIPSKLIQNMNKLNES